MSFMIGNKIVNRIYKGGTGFDRLHLGLTGQAQTDSSVWRTSWVDDSGGDHELGFAFYDDPYGHFNGQPEYGLTNNLLFNFTIEAISQLNQNSYDYEHYGPLVYLKTDISDTSTNTATNGWIPFGALEKLPKFEIRGGKTPCCIPLYKLFNVFTTRKVVKAC